MNNFFINHLKSLDWKLILSAFFLSLIGLALVYSISFGRGNPADFYKQIAFLAVGFAMMLALSFFDWKGFRDNSYFILVLYLFCLVLLAGLFFFAPYTRGIRGWYRIGGFLSFDPVGFSVIIVNILLAKFFSRRHVEMYKLRHIVLSGIYVALPFALIAGQPNLGSALILSAVWLGVLVVSGIKLKHFFILILIGLVIFSLGWIFFLKDYQKDRITGFLNPEKEVLGSNWSQTQSKIAIGSGGVWGKGFQKGSQTQNGFLSEPSTDFIISVLGEEFGIAGILATFLIFIYFIWRIIATALSAESNFPRLFSLGLAVFIFFQAFINIGMNLGVLPVIGLPMPLISYGGSNLLAIFAGLGILQSIRTNK